MSAIRPPRPRPAPRRWAPPLPAYPSPEEARRDRELVVLYGAEIDRLREELHSARVLLLGRSASRTLAAGVVLDVGAGYCTYPLVEDHAAEGGL